MDDYDTMKPRKNVRIKITVFPAILLALLVLCVGVFSVFPEGETYQRIGVFYNEPENSLQAVYIGSSNCYSFWNPLVAWHNYGLAVYPYSSASLPFIATEYLIREVRKTQPDAKFIVNVNAVDADDLRAVHIHYLLRYMPESENKEALQDALSEVLGYSEYDQLEFKYPWIRMRTFPFTVGKYILRNGFRQTPNGLKGATRLNAYLAVCEDISDDYIHTEQRAVLPEYLVNAAEKLLDYCDAEKIDVLFVTVPRAEYTENGLARINAMNDLISARGYPVLALTDSTEALGLDLTQDFYNPKHMNIHGSIKFTNYLSEYLIENFALTDLRGKADYESWEDSWKIYADGISPCVLPPELDTACLDISLKRPENLTAHFQTDGTNAAWDSVDGADGTNGVGNVVSAEVQANPVGGITVQWDSVDGADGYAVYRKDALKAPWREISAFQAETVYADADCDPNAEPYYAVVPLRKDGETVYYGSYTYMGVKAS